MSSYKGANNPMYGKTHTPEARKKISEARKRIPQEKHPSWKGGKRKTYSGYVEVRSPDHHRARGNGYVFEHIIVAEEKIGRRLKSGEHVHHINEIKTDNRPENLQVIDHGDHSRLHAVARRTGSYINCKYCGKEFYRKPCQAKNARYCSRRCIALDNDLAKHRRKNITKEKLTDALEKSNWNKKEAAKELEVHWSTVYDYIKKFGVKKNA